MQLIFFLGKYGTIIRMCKMCKKKDFFFTVFFSFFLTFLMTPQTVRYTNVQQ